MNIFIDCEFNGFGGDLISMAMVADDGTEFYEVLELENDLEYDPWVAENVVPILNKEPISKSMFQSLFWAFINKSDTIHVIADWPDDIKYFCQAIITGPGRALNTPKNLTMQIDRSLSARLSRIHHNALEDAKAIRDSKRKFDKELKGYGVKP